MHITLNDRTTPGFVFYENKKYFLFQTEPKVIKNQSILQIDRLTGKTTQINQKNLFDILKQHGYKKTTVWAIYGMVVIEQNPYLALVKQVKKVTPQRQNPIYQIQSLQYISFNPNQQQNSRQEEFKTLKYINQDIISERFYFSYLEDLTNCFRKKMRKLNDDNPQSKFFWNQKPLQFLKSNKINSKPWVIPIIQGYVGSISENGLQYLLIGKRSKHMSGTRYNNRGINIDGYASNFLQIEERIEFQNLIFSHLILRGSVPLFWKQQNGFSEVQFPHKQQKDLKGLKKHYDDLVSDYQCAINTVNLLSEVKASQKNLSDRFVSTLSKYSKNFYYYYDFKSRGETKLDDIKEFMDIYQSKQSFNNFQCYDFVKDKKINKQDFIPRINCLDCIDRTNVICCRIGQSFVRKVMKILNFSMTQAFHDKFLQYWADLGNRVSLIYCGTSSVSQHLTLKKQQSYLSMLTSSIRSVNRFLNASQNDNWKEQCNQCLLLQHQNSSTTYFVDNIVELYIKPTDFCSFFDINATIFTWNVGAVSSDELTEQDKIAFAEKIFGKHNQKAPQIVLITLQEIVQLNSYNVITNDNEKTKKSWEQIFFSILNHYKPQHQGFTYCLYFSEALVGITSFLFVKNSLNPKVDILNRIRKIFSYEVRRGYGGNLGNKGSIVSGFYIYDTIFVNFASHLAAGDQKRKQRLDDIKAIINETSSNKNSSKYYNRADYIFFTGDLNFRLGASDEQTRIVISEAKKSQKGISNKDNILEKNKILQSLLKKDELAEVYQKEQILKNFSQQEITFYPTYRYIKNGTEHDQKRKPGWCDRIFHYKKADHTLKSLGYSAINQVIASDHRAVIAEYRLQIRQQNKQIKQKLIRKYLNTEKQSLQILEQPKYSFPKTRYNY